MDPPRIDPGRTNSRRRLFLEAVLHIYGFRESDRIDRPIRIPPVVLDDLENTGAFAFPRLGVGWLPSDLHQIERVSKVIDHLIRKFEQVIFRRPDPVKWLFRKSAFHRTCIIYLIWYGQELIFL